MRFLVDMPLSPGLATWLRNNGHDAIHAWNVGLGSGTDEEILNRARNEGRVVITADLDYPRLLALAGSSGPGLILFRGGDLTEAQVVKMMERVMNAIPQLEMPRSIVVADNRSIRRRQLPFSD